MNLSLVVCCLRFLCLSFVVGMFSFVELRLLSVVCLLFVVCRLSFVVGYALCVVLRDLFVVSCWLLAVVRCCRLSFVVVCVLF